MAAEFQSQHHQWVTGPLAAVNPDKVEGDVGNYIRSLYKLEKSFQGSPKALHIATSVKAEVENFKEHIPLVQVQRYDSFHLSPFLRCRGNLWYDLKRVKCVK